MSYPIRATSESLTAVVNDVQRLVEGQHCLSDVVAFISQSDQKYEISEAVIQDEFSHDVIVKTGRMYYLVYAIT